MVTFPRTIAVIIGFLAFSPVSRSQDPSNARSSLAATVRSVREETARHPFPFRQGLVFDVFSPPNNLAGTGFLLKVENQVVAVTAGHPHPTSTPTKFLSGKRFLPLGARVWNKDDVSCFTVSAAGWPVFNHIRREGFFLKKGDEVAVVTRNGVFSGKLDGLAFGIDNMILRGEPLQYGGQLNIPGEYDFRGSSGAPIVLVETGEVIGVMQTAYNRHAIAGIHSEETQVGFWLLRFDPLIVRQPPTTLFSLAPVPQTAGSLLPLVSHILPFDLLELTPGMPIEELVGKRPYMVTPKTKVFEPGYSYEYAEPLDRDGFFLAAIYGVSMGKVSAITFRGAKTVPAPQVEALFNFFLASLGAPDSAFSESMVPGADPRTKPEPALYCRWNRPNGGLLLGASASGKEVRLLLFVAQSDKEFSQLFFQNPVPLPTDAASLQRGVRALVRDYIKLPATEVPEGSNRK